MKRTYIVDFDMVKHATKVYKASRKAHGDTTATFAALGALPVEGSALFDATSGIWVVREIEKNINQWYATYRNFLSCNSITDSLVFIQYPSYLMKRPLFISILKELRQHNNKVVMFIHDINCLRLSDAKTFQKGARAEKSLFDLADAMVVHSPQMAAAIEERIGVKKPTVCLEYFDYLSNITVGQPKDLRSVKLIFAGNLKKSLFIRELGNLPVNEDFCVYLYGVKYPYKNDNPYIQYKGMFNADDYSSIEGNWGLVWDGDSIETCQGNIGNYLRINAPFKFSLYLAANRPVVVWRQSAMAQYVEKYHLGICIDSLSEIPQAIAQLTDAELSEIMRNVTAASDAVRHGVKLKAAIEQAIKLLE